MHQNQFKINIANISILLKLYVDKFNRYGPFYELTNKNLDSDFLFREKMISDRSI